MKASAWVRVIPLVWIFMGSGAARADGDPMRGAELFQHNCAACHSAQRGQNLIGPSLHSVVGRTAASVADFSYSDAIRRSGIVWTTDQLVAYLKAPRRYIPGVRMMFPGLPDQKDREDVVAFLSQQTEATGTTVKTIAAPTPNAALVLPK